MKRIVTWLHAVAHHVEQTPVSEASAPPQLNLNDAAIAPCAAQSPLPRPAQTHIRMSHAFKFAEARGETEREFTSIRERRSI